MFQIFNSIINKKWLINLQIGWNLAPLIILLERYVFSDVQFILHLVVVVGVDTMLGTILAIKKRKFSSVGFGKLFAKLFVYLVMLIAIHNISNYEVQGERNLVLSWVDSVVYATIMIRELVSIFEKTTLLGYFVPPGWLIKRFQIFEETGSFEVKEKE
jgi:hypothetical protein